ncbi:MAG TPA: methionyl-tRNA formyltransferase [Caulobacteraceae bacterium]|jgi:methionyl-tRNA formyltransferase|nr:methionyl-tRNA formyltransferase [Caulobacteraceae bacterium]
MRIAFMGTPAFAVRALRQVVADGHEVAAVYTRAPAPRGRGQALQPSPVQVLADELGLAVRTPRNFRDPAEIDALRLLDVDAVVVVAYGLLLPRAVLELPRLGAFNLHGSLLPRWRGAAPIQRAIMAGDSVTGVQVMRMTEGLDEGPILLSETVPIAHDDTAATLHDRMAEVGAELLGGALRALERGPVVEEPQGQDGVTYARKISPAEARIDWDRPAVEIDRHIRGLSPAPGAWFEALTPKGPVRVKALMSRLSTGSGAPGEALDDRLAVACGQGAVRLLRVQREGRGPQDAEDFLRGLPIAAGEPLA